MRVQNDKHAENKKILLHRPVAGNVLRNLDRDKTPRPSHKAVKEGVNDSVPDKVRVRTADRGMVEADDAQMVDRKGIRVKEDVDMAGRKDRPQAGVGEDKLLQTKVQIRLKRCRVEGVTRQLEAEIHKHQQKQRPPAQLAVLRKDYLRQQDQMGMYSIP